MSRVLLTSLLALLAACTPRRPAEGAEEPPPVVLLGARLQSFEGEALVLSGEAARVTYQASAGEVVATDAVLRLPARPSGEQPSPAPTEVRAPRLEVQLPSRRVVGSGGVEVRTPDGAVARAPRGVYEGTQRLLRGTEGVSVQGPGYAVRSDTFQLSLEEGTFTFEGAVRTVLGAAASD